jgi:hypothetical protein
VTKQAPAAPQTSLPTWTNLSSARRAAGETLASPGDPLAQLSVVVLALDFCVLERTGTRATLDDTAELDAATRGRTQRMNYRLEDQPM